MLDSDTGPGGSYGGGGTWHFVSDGAYKATGAGVDCSEVR